MPWFRRRRQHHRHGATVYPERPFPFPDNRFPDDLGVISHLTVATGKKRAALVQHSAENHWLFADDREDPNIGDDLQLVQIDHVLSNNPDVAELASLPLGWTAWRSSAGDPWVLEERGLDDD
jgi:hypothetical protein